MIDYFNEERAALVLLQYWLTRIAAKVTFRLSRRGRKSEIRMSKYETNSNDKNSNAANMLF